MSDSVTVEQQVHFVRGTKGRKHLKSGSQTETPQRIPRIARLMALAIHFDELIRTGKVKDQSELAKLGRVSTARISQIMGLLYLAPEIQESILINSKNLHSEASAERQIRLISSIRCWEFQLLEFSRSQEFRTSYTKVRTSPPKLQRLSIL